MITSYKKPTSRPKKSSSLEDKDNIGPLQKSMINVMATTTAAILATDKKW